LEKSDGKRKAERQRLLWLNCTEDDLKAMGVNGWGNNALVKFTLSVILKEALAKL
jgi:hypothetical protein